MADPVTSFEELVEELQRKGVSRVAMAGKVATVTTPKGEQVIFRGRLVVTAVVGEGRVVEYVEQVAPYATTPEAPSLPVSPAVEPQLRQAQMALMAQLRAYREQYQARMAAARTGLSSRLHAVGIAVMSPEDGG